MPSLGQLFCVEMHYSDTEVNLDSWDVPIEIIENLISALEINKTRLKTKDIYDASVIYWLDEKIFLKHRAQQVPFERLDVLRIKNFRIVMDSFDALGRYLIVTDKSL